MEGNDEQEEYKKIITNYLFTFISDNDMVYQGVFCRWLSKTGNHIDERPVFDIYRKVEENGYMEIDICFPLK